jgi:hypothetical protein
MTLKLKGSSEPVRLSLRDFGGQQIYYGKIDCLDYLQNPEAFCTLTE